MAKNVEKKEETEKKKAKGVEELRNDILEELEQLSGKLERKEEEPKKQKSEKETKKEKVDEKKEDKVEIDEKKTKNKKALVKKEEKELTINSEKMEKIEEEIKRQTTISDERKNKINKVIFHNVAIACIILLYFIFLILGYQTIALDKFMIDLQVFSSITLGIAIIIFEKAYKNDSSEYAVHGIETLFLAIATLISTYVLSKYEVKFIAIMASVCYLFGIYYVGKSIVIYLKMRQKALKRTNDIHKIAKK